MEDLNWIKTKGKKAQGKQEYIKYRESGLTLSPQKAIIAHCYDCTCYYLDGKEDCGVKDCPLHPYMPYREGRIKIKKPMTEKQRESVEKLVSFRAGERRTANVKI